MQTKSIDEENYFLPDDLPWSLPIAPFLLLNLFLCFVNLFLISLADLTWYNGLVTRLGKREKGI